MFYFDVFPKVKYKINGDKEIMLTNITKRFKFLDNVLKNRYILYDYIIKGEETASEIAHRYYEDVTLDWIIFLTNKAIDPYFDWPLNDEEFQKYIIAKYGSEQEAKNKIYKYVQILQKKEKTIEGIIVPEKIVYVDQITYINTPLSDRKQISMHDREYELNQKKREIKIIDAQYIPEILGEVNNINE